MPKLSISRAWEETQKVLAHDGRLLASVALALIVLPQVVTVVVGLPVGPQPSATASLLYIAVVLLGFVAHIAINRLAIGPSVTVRDAIALGLTRLVPVFVAFFLVMIGLLLITVLVVMVLVSVKLVTMPVAGQPPPASLVALLILFSTLGFAIFQLVFPIAAIETGNPIRLLSRSWELGRRHYLRLLAFIIIVFVGLAVVAVVSQFAVGSAILLLLGAPNPGTLSALLLGLIVGTVQAAFTLVAATMLARIYVQLAGVHAAQVGVPRSGI